MKRSILLLSIVMSMLITACEEPDLTGIRVSAALPQSWTHAFEEQDNANSGTRIYRLTGSREFAPSWFRDVYEFKADGACRYLVLHPADVHYMADGKYSFDQLNGILSIYDSEDDLVKAFEVIRLETDLLVMRLKD